jgi:acetyl esterase/lipase
VPVRIYTPAGAGTDLPCLIWLHGGAFRMGDLDMPEADWTARQVCERASAVVVSVDYRLCVGGVTYPVPHDDVVSAVRWVRDNAAALGIDADRISLGGASAGGNLAAGATLRLMHHDGPIPALAVLAYPTLHAVQGAPDAALRAALDANPEADGFGPAAVLGMYENYLGGPADGAEIFAVPGTATTADLAGFPPTIMINGEVDELRVSGEAFAASLAAAGTAVDVSTEPGTGHGHLNNPDQAAAAASLDRFAARILELSPTRPLQGATPGAA